jgi:PadR family transcriptional regulator PadR
VYRTLVHELFSLSETDSTSQLRRGVLELCVLRLLSEKASYGYEVVTTFERLGPLATGENTVYPLLRRLKSDKYLETFEVESPNGPPRQYYRLSKRGQQRLKSLQTEWAELAQAVERCLTHGGKE